MNKPINFALTGADGYIAPRHLKAIKETYNNLAAALDPNIGVHFFDMLTWIFGLTKDNIVHVYNRDIASGFLQLERSRVRWFLSVNSSFLPKAAKEKKQTTFRSITIEGEKFEFSDDFTDLHTQSYKEILVGNRFRLQDARQSLEIVHDIRNNKQDRKKGERHPFLINTNLL
ncbi:hypothetical protein ACFLSI_03495 [Bacteroidota bacterium]